MQLEVIGVGGAGCRVADAIRSAEPATHSFLCDVFAFDTDTLSLEALDSVPDEHRHRYGAEIENGLNGNLQRGESIGKEHVDELSRQLDQSQPSAADAFLVTVGLGGATGGGTAPELVANLRTLYDEPVYVLATLPADRERSPGGDPSLPDTDSESTSSAAEAAARPLAAENATRTLSRLDGCADAVICFDNEQWLRTGESIAEGRERLNGEVAMRVAAVFAASTTDDGRSAETVIDASDVGRVLGSETTIATLGYGTQQIETDSGSRFGLGLFSAEATVETSEAVQAIETVIQKALHGKLTLECDRDNARRAMLVVGGPPEWLNRRAITDGRRELESAIGSRELLGGDAPRPDGDEVFAVVLFAGVDPVDRLESLRAAAEQTQVAGTGSNEED